MFTSNEVESALVDAAAAASCQPGVSRSATSRQAAGPVDSAAAAGTPTPALAKPDIRWGRAGPLARQVLQMKTSRDGPQISAHWVNIGAYPAVRRAQRGEIPHAHRSPNACSSRHRIPHLGQPRSRTLSGVLDYLTVFPLKSRRQFIRAIPIRRFDDHMAENSRGFPSGVTSGAVSLVRSAVWCGRR